VPHDDHSDGIPRHRTEEITKRTRERTIWENQVRALTDDMREVRAEMVRDHNRIGALEHFRTALTGDHGNNGRLGRMSQDIDILKEWRGRTDERYSELRTATTVTAVKVGLVMTVGLGIIMSVLTMVVRGG
jgi:hypothetical protein